VYGHIGRFITAEKYQGISDHLMVDRRPGYPSALSPNLFNQTQLRRIFIDGVGPASILPVFMGTVLVFSIQVLDSKPKCAGVTEFTTLSNLAGEKVKNNCQLDKRPISN
jgi:hypothetical protein